MSKKLFGLLLMILLISTTCFAEKKTTVNVWMGFQTPERNQFMKKLFKEFEAKNPGIRVAFLGIPGDPNAYKQKLDTAVAAGDEPDISMNFYPDYIERGVYLPLDRYFKKWKDKKKIQPSAIQSNRAMDVRRHKLYAIPYASIVRLFWVRPDWFQKAKLPIFTTWNEFFNAIPKLTNKSKGRYGTSIRGGGASAENLEMMMYAYSGITKYFTKRGKCTINNSAHVQFVKKYLGLYNVYSPEDDLTKGWVALAASFQSGKAAIVFHNMGSAEMHNKAFKGDTSKFMAVNFPKSVKGYQVHPNIKPHGWSIHKSSKHKAKAWKVIEFLLSKDANSKYCKTYSEIPLNLEALKEPWLQKSPWFKTSTELMTSKATRFYSPPYYLPAWSSLLVKDVEPMIQKVMVKQMSAKEMLDRWARLMEQANKELKASLKK